MVILYFIKLNAILDAVTCSAIKMQSDRACADGKSLVARLNTLAPGRAPSVVRSAHAARIVSVPLCFFANALELFLEASEIFVIATANPTGFTYLAATLITDLANLVSFLSVSDSSVKVV